MVPSQFTTSLPFSEQLKKDVSSRGGYCIGQIQTQPMPMEPLQPNMVARDKCTCTVSKIISDNYFAQTHCFENDLSHVVPNRLKTKIVNEE